MEFCDIFNKTLTFLFFEIIFQPITQMVYSWSFVQYLYLNDNE